MAKTLGSTRANGGQAGAGGGGVGRQKGAENRRPAIKGTRGSEEQVQIVLEQTKTVFRVQAKRLASTQRVLTTELF